MKYPGLDNQVLNQLQEALKKDYSEHLQAHKYMKDEFGYKREDADMTMRDVEFAGGELRRDGGFMGIKREEETDIRLMIDKSGTFEREMAGLKLPSMFESPFQGQSKDFLDKSNISPDIVNIANQLLNGLDDNFPMMNLEDVPFLHDNMNDDIDNLDNQMGGPNGPPNQD